MRRTASETAALSGIEMASASTLEIFMNFDCTISSMRILLALLLCSLPGWGEVKIETGEINGAKFRIDMPEKWNGGLVMYCHGYNAVPGKFDDPKPNPALDALVNVFLK